MMWPKLFSNRDYVFIRKHFIDRQRNLILIVNKSTKHPNVPVKKGLQRVKEYWSFMVIKPKTTFDKPGVEFILTYFDHPGKSQKMPNIKAEFKKSRLAKNRMRALFSRRKHETT
jgi:StAR-related lipid transfer protein 7, mitochondrial